MPGAALRSEAASNQPYVIEAEDFNFSRGQAMPVASVMPYAGGAYLDNSNAVVSVDFFRTTDSSSPIYRNDKRIPIFPSTDLSRGAWSVTQNYRLGNVKNSDWFNYTRNVPPGKYLAYAALSHGETAEDLCQGTLSLVTSAATNTSQVVSKKGTFKAAGTGDWYSNRVVGLKDTAGRFAVLDLGTNSTVRYTVVNGWVDYMMFVPAQAPVIGVQPVDLTVTENTPASFSLALGSDDAAAFQWQTNQINVFRATNSTLSLVPSLAADGMKVRCVLTNVLGTTISSEVTLRVVPDVAPPVAVRAQNLGRSLVRLTFNEPVQLPLGNPVEAFGISGGVSVTSVLAGTDTNSLDLTLGAPLTYGQSYVVTLQGVRDLAATPNAVPAGTQLAFVTQQYVSSDVGRPGVAGSDVAVPGGYDITGAGTDVGGTSDQFHFSWEPVAGDFDLQTRIASATVTDSFLHAGLMARETLATNTLFAASFASSMQLGCFFEVRKTAASSTITTTAPGGVPVNYPETWLRLRRQGNVLSGYASLDGLEWVLLGTNSFTTLSNTVLVGLAVASQSATESSTVAFRNIGPTSSDVVIPRLPDRETLGASSRRTGLVFSEIMYHPRSVPAPGPKPDLEFIEIYNAGAIFEDLSGYRISGGVDYSFPEGFQIRAGDFLVIAADPAAVQAAYGIQGVLGPWQGSLNNGGDTVRLNDGAGAVKLEVTYSVEAPWPVAADGAGPSLVLSRPSFGEADSRAWSASLRVGGSPGQLDPISTSPLGRVVINEFMAHPLAGQSDFIELHNPSKTAVDIGGCVLTDDPSTNKFRIPAGTLLPARGFVAFDDTQLGFGLSARGESLLLLSPDGSRVLDAVKFSGQEAGVASGRTPDGSDVVRRLSLPTPGTTNAPRRLEDVVINEIMYKPISQSPEDEYVEIYNRSAAAVDLGGWRFVSGIGFTFPAGTLLAPDGYLVVARNQARLLSRHPNLTAAVVKGNFSGTLAGSGERVALARPLPLVAGETLPPGGAPQVEVVVSEVTYSSGGRWGRWAAGGGSSLELIDPRADLLQAASWADSDESAKGQWVFLSTTNVLIQGNSGYAPNRLQIMQLGEGESLVDEVESLKPGSTNLLLNGNFQSTNTSQRWELGGTHAGSTIDTNGGFGDSRCLHIRAQGDGDTGVNSIRRSLQSGLNQGNTNILRARARWVAGWPELLFRLQGNWQEMFVRLPVPENLGTPGIANSRRVANAGPALYAVQHSPAIPRANEPVVVTCRVSDPDGIGGLVLRYRFDPSLILTNIAMLDDGTAGDAVAGDGVYSALLPARASGLAAFRIEATDAAASPASTVFPALAPAQECLVRWGDALPFGTFAHYHLWNTAATDTARNSSTALNNLYRDATLVHGSGRIIYNAGFRDKGSPYHSGSGDYAVTVPDDDMLLGVRDRVFGSTGNGNSEDTALRGRVANWIARKMGLPYLHAHYILLYRNGALHQNVSEDAEQPSNPYAESWYPTTESGELFKIAVWFEDGSTSGATGATMEQFKLSDGAYNLGRYRWNWQLRAVDSANNFTNFFNLVDAINSSGDNAPGLSSIADMDEWMRVFAYHRVVGNWDSWTYNVGQNMYLYRQPGAKWVLIPWDIDFVLGAGNGATDPLWVDGQDPVMNSRVFVNPPFRRMLYRAFLDAIAGPLQPANYRRQIEDRRVILSKNKISAIPPTDVISYIDQRRESLKSQLAASDVAGLTISANSGNDYVSPTAVTTLTGKAAFAVATIEINDIPYPVKWTSYSNFSISIPLAAGANVLRVVGRDLRGNIVSGATDTVTVTFNGTPQEAGDYVVINEIQYNPLEPRSSFLELHNRSSTTPFDLSGFRLDGLGYVFPPGSIIGTSGYLVLAKDRVAFSVAYGSGISVWDEFTGSLDGGGEHLKLVKPGLTPAGDVVINDVRYDNVLPWPPSADGFGPSLQLVDASQDSYRVGNWGATGSNDVARVTPGKPNATRQPLAPFPRVWLNEVLPANVSGPVDNMGDKDPYLELYNSGDTDVDLSAFYLSDSYTNLTRWQFPQGTVIAAGQFLVIWLDGEPGETAPGSIHADFRIQPSAGSLALSRLQGVFSTAAVMDYLDYGLMAPGRSLGCIPDGQPRDRRVLYHVTPGAANDPLYPDLKVTLNEVMAVNQKTILDSASGKFSDWFELYNAGTTAVDLSGYWLTDKLTDPSQFVIPAGYVIPAGGFLLVWADGDPSLNQPGRADLHVNFKLSEGGEDLGLFAPDNRMVDGFTFGAQVADYSLGRYPDGAAGSMVYMPIPTPRARNNITLANFPPTIGGPATATATEMAPFTLNLQGSDPNVGQSLTYSLVSPVPEGAAIHTATGLFSWTPTEAQGPGSFVITVKAVDSGVPPLTTTRDIRIDVLEANLAPQMPVVPPQEVIAGQTLRFQILAVDADLPAQALRYGFGAAAPLGAAIHPESGEFSWPASAEQVGAHVITLAVTDDGVPPLTRTVDVTVNVREPVQPPSPVIAATLHPDGTLRLSWSAVDAVNYRVQYKDSLSQPAWINMDIVTGLNGAASLDGLDTLAAPERYYRVISIP